MNRLTLDYVVKVVSVVLLAHVEDICTSLYLSMFVTASTQGIHLVVGLEEETLDEIGATICVNPE